MKINEPTRLMLGAFELNLKTGELCLLGEDSDGRRVLLQEQPFRVLRFLIDCGGEIATREEIKRRLWPNDTIVDFDHSINVAIATLRRAFGDSAVEPRYIETIPRRGYRLMVPVEPVEPLEDQPKDQPGDRPTENGSQLQALKSGLIGKKISHFRVLEVIGGGGMGMVFKAEDLKLGRLVALKFLPEELAGDPASLRRFEREAQTASSLNHPNICTIFEIEEFEEQPIIVMELLDGETLRDRLAAPDLSNMEFDQLLEIALQTSCGLEAAHAKGIIHRDIKPANIFLTRYGQIKILDFGLAKLVESEEVAEKEKGPTPPLVSASLQTDLGHAGILSRTGMQMGTASYMSPEQIRKEVLDPRSDLFSFGLVLYEMVTGRRAFDGDSVEDVHQAILHSALGSTHEAKLSLPRRLDTIISKALEKDRACRYQCATEMREDLLQVQEGLRHSRNSPRKAYEFAGEVSPSQADSATQGEGRARGMEGSRTDGAHTSDLPKIEAAPGTPKTWRNGVLAASSIFFLALAGYMSWRHFQPRELPKAGRVMLAVLPFENLTGDPNKEYLADGLTEETISQLGQLNPEELGVIARTSVMGYKHKDARLDEIGRDLSVQYVLEDSLRESGEHLRLTAQLIQVKDQTHLWSQDYDYPAKDILNVEDEVAKAVAHEIRVRLTTKQQAKLAQSYQVNPEAFDAYLQGHYFFEKNTDKDTDMAAKYYERATQLDPSYALAWVGLSRTRNWQANVGLIPAEAGRRLAREAVERALALNPNLAEAYVQMGRIKLFIDFDWAGADASLKRAIALDPGNSDTVRAAATMPALVGRFDEALQLARRAVDLDPLNADSWEGLGEKEFFMGQLDKAAADTKKGLELSPDAWPGPIQLSPIYLMQGRPQDALPEIELVRIAPYRATMYAIAYHALGRKKESDAALSELIKKYHASNPCQIAQVYAFRNQPDEAFEWLDRAFAQRDDDLIYTKVLPLLKNLHGDPRFSALLKKLNLPN